MSLYNKGGIIFCRFDMTEALIQVVSPDVVVPALEPGTTTIPFVSNGKPIYRAVDDRLEVDPLAKTATLDGELLKTITPMGFNLLTALTVHAGQVMPPVELGMAAWKGLSADSAVSRVHNLIPALRKCFPLELAEKEGGAIRNKRGIGYYIVKSLAGNGRAENLQSPVHYLADNRVEVRPKQHIVIADGESLESITPIGLKILTILANVPDKLISSRSLCEMIWGYYDSSARQNLGVHIVLLRKKLGLELGDPKEGLIRSKQRRGFCVVSSLRLKEEDYLSTES